ncbi:MAG: vanadium-dependent haloperoxidase, partial [Gammaproteobacteria bacterium]|nr:vanadium-dependent haloperoxidase [Gammaproteobacteria bacterium]
LSDIASTKLLQKSKALGEAAARAVLAKRKDDGWDTEAEYQWHPMAPGVYAEFREHSGTPEGFIFGAGWAKAQGFALQTPGQFRSPPPPEILSDAYTQAFGEVKGLGRFQSMHRTPDQTHIALWWKDFAENSHNRLARDLIEKEELSLAEAVRLLALLNMGIFDAYVSSFDNKFYYNHWRPFTAIRWAANDGNPDTTPEETWTNTHRHTYAFPSYPSAHGTACAAAMTAFENVFGNEYAFTMRIAMVDIAGPFSGKVEMHPPTRNFKNFSEAATQCGLSRVYLGIHFRYDSVAGVNLGRAVGRNVVDNYLQPKDTENRN